MNLRELGPPADLPAEARLPAVAVRVALALVAALLTLMVYGYSGWLVVGVLFGLLAAWQPEYLLAWPLIVFWGIGELGREATLSWQLLVLLAGVQIFHLLAMQSLALPWGSWMQLSAFAGPLRRLVAIQLPVQLLAVGALLLLAPAAHGQRPLSLAAFTLVGAGALSGLALLLLRK